MSDEPKKDKKGTLEKVAPFIIPVVVSLCMTVGGVLVKHEAGIRKTNRMLERVSVDKYRRNLQHYRAHYEGAKDCVVRNKRISRALTEGDDLIAVAVNMAEQCEEDKDTWKELIENFVEENKHMGYD